MKKLNFLFAILVIVAALVSCNKLSNDEFTDMSVISLNSIGTITPIPGNPSCIEDGMWNFKIENLIDQVITLPNGQILTLDFSEDGKYLTWSVSQGAYCIESVLVKGGNKGANLYSYDECTFTDTELHSPIMTNGNTPAISHVCFSFGECECEEDLVIAVKCFFHKGTNPWEYCSLSEGLNVFAAAWCGEGYLGIKDYPETTSFNIVVAYNPGWIVGNVTVGNGLITVTLNGDYIQNRTYVYVGTLEDLLNTNLGADGCPDYTNSDFWMSNLTGGTSVSFPMP